MTKKRDTEAKTLEDCINALDACCYSQKAIDRILDYLMARFYGGTPRRTP